MKRFLSVAGPIALTLAFWTLIDKIPMPGFILLPLVVFAGLLMMFGMGYFARKVNKQK
jgi:hypothetical protein